MSLALPSDLILDVARAAEPARMKAAVARLQEGAEAGFAQALARAEQTLATGEADLRSKLEAMRAGPAIRDSVAQSPGAKFETMMLQVFVQSMIPQSSKMFGKGAAGGAYKTFLAEQIAAQLAKAGGIGVAGMIDQRVAALKEAAAKSTAGA